MSYRYYLVDVFTDERFGGNQLAVLPEAEGLSDAQMQQIAREFNFSESTFVLPAEQGHTRRVRIFTPNGEVPFAGHPNIGTAFALATAGEFGKIDGSIRVAFEASAGVVPISIQERGDQGIWCELAAPESIALGAAVTARQLASAASLAEGDVVTGTHPPRVASVGLPFLIAELKDRSALERARPDLHEIEALAARQIPSALHLYIRSRDEFDVRARMFAPLAGVPEDPATGSASCALAGLLAHYDEAGDAAFELRIAQGVEMGRPSVLQARAEKRAGSIVATYVGGACVLVGEGVLHVD